MVCSSAGILMPHLRRGATFFSGIAFGIALAVVGPAIAEGLSSDKTFRESILYALGELAIDSESNAARIVSLDGRIDDVERRLAELAKAGK